MSIPAYKNVSEDKLILPTYNASVSLSPGQYVVGTYYAFLDGNTDYEKTADYTTLPWVETNQIRYVYPEELLTEETTPPITQSPTVEIPANKLRLVTPDGYAVSLEADADNLESNLAFVLPISNGDSGDVLTTDGTGILSWTTPATGGSYVEYSSSDTPRSILAAESGSTFANQGASSTVDFNLPSTITPGLKYHFIKRQNVHIMNINATGEGNNIIDSAGAAGSVLSTTATGSSVTLVAVSSTSWLVTASLGTWTGLST